MQRKLRIITIATGIYGKYLPALVESIIKAHQDFLENITLSIFSDSTIHSDSYNKVKIDSNLIQHKPWPSPTLERYKNIFSISDKIEEDEIIIYVDVDMIFQTTIDTDNIQNLFGIMHPGYFNKKRKPFVRNSEYSSYVPRNKRQHYLCGGVQGGVARNFLEAAGYLSKLIDKDLKVNKIPKWHDESYWNYYHAEHPEKFYIFGPEYCWPEEWVSKDNPGKIIALTKDVNTSKAKSRTEGFFTFGGKIKRYLKKQHY